eukprot:3145017-Prymnesium_polylepis.1
MQWKFRARYKLYATLGPGLLQRPGWDGNYYGELISGESSPAPWLVVPDTVDAKQVVQLID